MGAVVPKMVFIFKEADAELPLITRLFIGCGEFISANWFFILITAAASVFFIARVFRTKKARVLWERVLLKTPFIGKIIKKAFYARFSQVLGLLLRNGVPISEALGIVSTLIPNKLISDELREIRQKVLAGEPLSKCLSRSDLFFAEMSEMAAVGEETGNLENSLDKISKTYESQYKNEINALMRVLEPALTFVLALWVALLVSAMLLPILNMNISSL
jgi:type II secretory pathway component PulF